MTVETDLRDLLTAVFDDLVEACADEGLGNWPLIKYGEALVDLHIPISDNAIVELRRYVEQEYRIYLQQRGRHDAQRYLTKALDAQEILNLVLRERGVQEPYSVYNTVCGRPEAAVSQPIGCTGLGGD